MERSAKILGDAPDRSYATKLEQFTNFAVPELRRIFSGLALPSHGTALDVGCGTGLATSLLADELGPEAVIVGLDLSLPHLQAARRQHRHPLVQGDAERLCFQEAAFDFIWCCNTINHVADKAAALRVFRECLRPGGHFVLAQSSLLPEMYFAWDSHLDDAVRTACHHYYRDRYGLRLEDTAAIRAIVGLMNDANFSNITVRTHMIERTQPLSPPDREYFQQAVFEGLWGERIWPFLDSTDRRKLQRYCDPSSAEYCLDRSDFHHVQTITVCIGAAPT